MRLRRAAQNWCLLAISLFMLIAAAAPDRHPISSGNRKYISIARQLQRDVGRAERNTLRRVGVFNPPPPVVGTIDAHISERLIDPASRRTINRLIPVTTIKPSSLTRFTVLNL